MVRMSERPGEVIELEPGKGPSKYADPPMYCRNCNAWVKGVFVEGVGWTCTVCDDSPVYESIEAMIEVDHDTALFNKMHGYGPWWDGDSDE